MTTLVNATIPRTLDRLVERFSASPATRIEAWLFEDEAARRTAERRLAAAGTQARLRSAYKPLLHFFLEEVAAARPRRVAIRTPAGDARRFRLEAYPLAGLLADTELVFTAGDEPLHGYVEIDGEAQRVFVPHRADGSICGWLRVWQDGQWIEDGPLQTDFEAAYAVAMDAVRAHTWSRSTPYFDTLEIDIATGGIERRLPYHDECISTREALHEDLYFSVLAFFQRRAGVPDGDRTLQPGQIVPRLRAAEGPTQVRVALLSHPAVTPESGRAPALESLDRPLAPGEVEREMEALAAAGGTRFGVPTAQGRQVLGLHVAGALPGLVVTGGQHANETSGVVGALRAARALAQRAGAHFAVIASENPDGSALHLALREDNPRHMLHAARYSALGDDLEARAAPPYGEKAARLEAIERTGARLHLSLHGYPAHEWTRPLNGYIPQGFEQWTIPKGFFLILRHHAGLNGMAFLQALTAELASDPKLAAFNARCLATWHAHYGEMPLPVLHGIPCMVMEDHRSTVPFTLVPEFPDQTVYGDAFRLAHTTQMRTVLAAAELYWRGLLDGEAVLA
ncbi:hypothetical protein P3W85_03045 [Cupriavidus basilensis]|uniref:Peptidase M14 n=1 Tax=Cupriavidus basilensis TaxID=68895 RepID=A0ABT6AH56_9BURK|nr:hypothetical protein [Cupriavidus basilensis]MDF3831936.1 hypothetical protein [Cupriavidus basilensis]